MTLTDGASVPPTHTLCKAAISMMLMAGNEEMCWNWEVYIGLAIQLTINVYRIFMEEPVRKWPLGLQES